MTAVDHAKALYALISKLRARHAPPPACKDGHCPLRDEAGAPSARGQAHCEDEFKPLDGEPPVCPIEACFHGDRVLREFVRSFLVWEATVSKADAAMARIAEAVVDTNELRVCMPEEIASILGTGYPRLDERVQRLRGALGEIFKREHGLRLDHLTGRPKREGRTYLESLHHAPRFAATRTALVALDAHAFPVDGRIHARLVSARACSPDHTPDDAGAWMERTLKAGEAAHAYHLIQMWADGPAGGPRPARKRAASTAPRRTPAARKKPTK